MLQLRDSIVCLVKFSCPSLFTNYLYSSAGARLVSEERLGLIERGIQWSKIIRGGKVPRCDGMRLIFSPAYEEKLIADF